MDAVVRQRENHLASGHARARRRALSTKTFVRFAATSSAPHKECVQAPLPSVSRVERAANESECVKKLHRATACVAAPRSGRLVDRDTAGTRGMRFADRAARDACRTQSTGDTHGQA